MEEVRSACARLFVIVIVSGCDHSGHLEKDTYSKPPSFFFNSALRARLTRKTRLSSVIGVLLVEMTEYVALRLR